MWDFNKRGVTVVAALIAVLLLGAVGAGMAYFMASNQQTRIQEITRGQAIYSNMAGMEYALRRIQVEGLQSSSMTKKFVGETITIMRTGGNINVSTAKKDARIAHSIVDPNPPNFNNCLIINTAAAAYAVGNTRLIGITLSRNADCTGPITLTSMTGTIWMPDMGERLNGIQIDAITVFNGSDVSGGTFNFAPTITLNDTNPHDLNYIQWDTAVDAHNFRLIFNFTFDGAPYSRIADVNFLAANQADCFDWTTTNARLTYNANLWRQLTGTTVSNICDKAIRLDKMTVSWNPVGPARNLTNVQINGGAEEYTGSAAGGVQIEVDDVISLLSSEPVDYFQFDDEMLGRNYSVTWTFVDGTAKTMVLDIFNANEDTCLNIAISNAYLDNAGANNDIRGVTIENTCAADIGMTGITLSWAGEGLRRLTSISVDDTDGTNVYASNNRSGVMVDLGGNDLYLINGSGVKDINYLRFNTNVTPGLEFTLMFTMADGSTKSVTFTPGTEAQCLNVDTIDYSIGGGGRNLLGITTQNTCNRTITWTQTRVSWTPAGGRRMQSIRVSGADIWNGSATTGTLVNNADVSYAALQSRPIDRFRFDGNMDNRRFIIVFTMADASTVTVNVSYAECLGVDTSVAKIEGAGFIDLTGITITNNCTAATITWDRTTVSWSPVLPARTMQRIVADGSQIWSGSVNSGAQVNNNNVDLTPGQSKPIDRFRFSGNMTGRTFTIVFTMADMSTKTTPSFSP